MDLKRTVSAAALAVLLGATWISSVAAELSDVTEASNLHFRHHSGATGDFYLPEIMGSGTAVFDYDGDGDLDLYLIDSAGPNVLLAWTGERYEDATARSGLGNDGYGMGAALGDVDNDGDLDVLVTNYGVDVLYRNDGRGRFTDITAASGIAGDAWSMSAAFCDVDEDGWLDLYVTTYVTNHPPMACRNNAGEVDYCAPSAYAGLPDRIYRNKGGGRFEDVSATSGIGARKNSGLVLIVDLDGDHHDDVFIANDGEPNYLWVNDGKGGFTEHGLTAGVAVNLFGQAEASMGIALGDVDGDLRHDLFITHLDQETNTLYRNLGEYFVDATVTSGLGNTSMPYTGFGVAFADLDLDGDLDAAVANGRVRKRPGAGDAFGEPNQAFLNGGQGHFGSACSQMPAFCEPRGVSRGLIAADVDRDGAIDLLVTDNNGKARLYRNVLTGGNWLALHAVDPALGRDAVGATIVVETTTTTLTRPVMHGGSYLSSTGAGVHVGLGSAARAERITVVWPDGFREAFAGVPANRRVVLRRGDGE